MFIFFKKLTFASYMKKQLLDMTVVAAEQLSERHTLLRLTCDEALPPIAPGQFVEVRVDGSATTFLRRPISINNVDRAANELWLLVAAIGEGTRALSRLCRGDKLNCLLPLGKGFTMPASVDAKPLLVGGGVGVAPLLLLGNCLRDAGIEPTFLLGARTVSEVLELSLFEQLGRVCIATEDGSLGQRGFVTDHKVLSSVLFSRIYTCGPKSMMIAVARYARKNAIECEASLENKMACGLGACLCCVEKTVKGNVCVCSEGPVFNINTLSWQI